tara:strand:+ start:60 stop:302 length:243 start_codon:yes stop_codon:yes gene_type:complete
MTTPIALNAEGPSSPGGTSALIVGNATPKNSGNETNANTLACNVRRMFCMEAKFLEKTLVKFQQMPLGSWFVYEKNQFFF